MKEKLVLVGNGMAGIRTLENILKTDNERFDMTVFGTEPYPNYNRILLSKVLQGDTKTEDITLNDWNWYKEHHIQLFTNETIVKIDPDNQTVMSDQGRTVHYDRLILATGSLPFIPPIPGSDKKGVTAFRTLQDTEEMVKASMMYKKAAVIGGGLLGLEAARGLLNLGMEVIVIHLGSHLMDRQLDPVAGQLLQAALEKQGMSFLLGKQTNEILGDTRVEGLTFSDGSTLETDMVVMAAGIKPNHKLAETSGIEVNRGIIVNDFMETSVPRIYAVGECVEHRGQTYGLVAPLYDQANVLAKHVCDMAPTPYEGSVLSTQLKVSGVDVFSAGDFIENDEKQAIKIFDEQQGIYQKLVFQQNRLVGAVMFGETSDGPRLFSYIREGVDMSDMEKVSVLTSNELAQENTIEQMANDHIVCGCNGVSKGQIVAAIQKEGLTTIQEVKQCTSASRSCGGCQPVVEEILWHTLGDDANRTAQKETICACEIKEKGLQHVKEVMSVLDWETEEGCSKCRPALNYYLGMMYPLDYKDEKSSRFVNERMHANIQNDGTYSVVPRMYGGVTNANDLRKIADVVDKYEIPLVKMTGGQRIDLLGVKKEDLPKVWADLDMPSGYAYGKSLRTVKTCVGEQFCRFGTQDSISLGIALEKKFEGLATPHKVKMAVSACPRNCAESGIKDLGIVGIDGGFELYAGGNGGTHLRAGDLLMKVSTAEEVEQMAAAYLQYYRETANYLERTSAWVERLGLNHIQTVLLDDQRRAALIERMDIALSTYEEPWQEIRENETETRQLFQKATASV
ncbi:nitrite reductase large subunit NirB [Bacillus altitudinis]|uniref:nitrite reductase large subunit NirB n=1 Tax=Bacillus altitudinis TaxID=293387 RepID=UPI0022812F2D|nr:nitrite reductase large subunit NirB [Bacillus altitudinis]MCY7672767.1 nitrite reductase large subunit NirB [Bacillus altitudinis]